MTNLDTQDIATTGINGTRPKHRLRSRIGLISLGLWTLIACEQIIGGDFDPKSVDPNHFSDGGQGGDPSDEDSAVGDGDGKTSGDETSGDGDTGSGGRSQSGSGGVKGSGGTKGSGGEASGGSGDDGSGGEGSGGTSTGGSASGGNGSGGDDSGSGGDGGDGSGGEQGNSEPCFFGSLDCEFDVVLNEVRAQGGTDFIELYNRGANPINLEGLSITDGDPVAPDASHRLIFPEVPAGDVYETVIPPGGHLFFQDGGSDITCLATNCGGLFDFGVSAGGETVFLLDPTSNIIDSLDYPDEEGPKGLSNGQTWGRFPDGSEFIVAIQPPSPGAANSEAGK